MDDRHVSIIYAARKAGIYDLDLEECKEAARVLQERSSDPESVRRYFAEKLNRKGSSESSVIE